MAEAAAAPAPGSREPIRTLHARGYVNMSAQARKNYEHSEALVRRLAGDPIEHASVLARRRQIGKTRPRQFATPDRSANPCPA
jgi:hypothetical protein